MALVSYDYGSESEDEIEEPDEVEIVKSEVNLNEASVDNTFKNVSKSSLIFARLPRVKEIINVTEDKVEDFIPKAEKIKSKQKIQITVPSLSDFDNIDDDLPKKSVKASVKGSGLLSLLPPVKGTPLSNKSFVPNVVSKQSKPLMTKSSNQLTPQNVQKQTDLKKAASIKKVSTNQHNSEEDTDDEMELPETFDEETWTRVCGRPERKKIIEKYKEQAPESNINIAPDPVEPYQGLDNTAFKELIGKSKRPIGNIKLIDINEEDILPEKDLWMSKSLTDPEYIPKPSVENPVDPTRKRKHHITFLAEQAKANEQELKNQWAVSKHSRTQTRAKYGF